MAHDHPLDIKPAPARTSQSAGCGACCGASDHAPAASASVPLGGGQRFRIPAMDCAAEESDIRRALTDVPGIRSLNFRMVARTLTIYANDDSLAAAVAAFGPYGYKMHPTHLADS